MPIKTLAKLGALATAAVAVVGNALGSETIETSTVVNTIAMAHAVRVLLRRGYTKWIAVVLILATVPKFRLGVGRPDADKVSLANHLLRFLAFWRVDLKLPPLLPVSLIARTAVKHGLWQRHLSERDWADALGPAYRFYFPLNNLNSLQVATMCAFFTKPEDVEEILTQQKIFPSRGRTGFTDLLGEGLLGMHSGEKWARHRHLVSRFLSHNHLKAFSVVIAEETDVLLNKWTSCPSVEPNVGRCHAHRVWRLPGVYEPAR
jgi:hypothetical protein